MANLMLQKDIGMCQNELIIIHKNRGLLELNAYCDDKWLQIAITTNQ